MIAVTHTHDTMIGVTHTDRHTYTHTYMIP